MRKSVVISVIAILALLFIFFGCCQQVDTGEVGLKTWFGKIVSDALPEGIYFYSPIGGNVVIYDAKQQRADFDTEIFTKDLQAAQVKFVVNFSLDRSHIKELHTNIGRMYEKKLVEPLSIAAIKDVIGQWQADELVPKREEATRLVYSALTNSLSRTGVKVDHVSILNIDFSESYEKAVEAKQVAMQEAIRAKNVTTRIEEESRQAVITAEAEAKAMEVRAKALEKNKGLILYEAVNKWDGKLPVYMMGDNTLFLKELGVPRNQPR
ncbi:MAG: prohibitin family protein [Kiritimatiellae bacterium]|nr:prohibitin family protein [Kiritimatiellia bacterium]